MKAPTFPRDAILNEATIMLQTQSLNAKPASPQLHIGIIPNNKSIKQPTSTKPDLLFQSHLLHNTPTHINLTQRTRLEQIQQKKKRRRDRSKTFGSTEGSKDRLVPKRILPTLHHQGEPVVDALGALLLHFDQKATIFTPKNHQKKLEMKSTEP